MREAQAALILGKEPQNRDGLYISATALLGQGKLKEALAVLEAVPGRHSSRSRSDRRGSSRAARKVSAEAERGLSRYPRQESPRMRGAWRHCGAMHLGRNQPAEALKLSEQAKAIQPVDPGVRHGIAIAQHGWAISRRRSRSSRRLIRALGHLIP